MGVLLWATQIMPKGASMTDLDQPEYGGYTIAALRALLGDDRNATIAAVRALPDLLAALEGSQLKHASQQQWINHLQTQLASEDSMAVKIERAFANDQRRRAEIAEAEVARLNAVLARQAPMPISLSSQFPRLAVWLTGDTQRHCQILAPIPSSGVYEVRLIENSEVAAVSNGMTIAEAWRTLVIPS
jgi:hypothetical protein